MLAHQLPALPPMESFWAELPAFFEWLVGGVVRAIPNNLPGGSDEAVFRPDRMRSAFSLDSPLETIQFAAANRLCIALGYHSKIRTVEPLSFRQSKAGNRLFYGYERDSNQVKAYSLSKIQSVSTTNIPYTERYPVEISHSGPIRMLPVREQ